MYCFSRIEASVSGTLLVGSFFRCGLKFKVEKVIVAFFCVLNVFMD